jgi:hypothetical protein
MPQNLEFKPCPHCQKSVRSDATRCHRCHQPISPKTFEEILERNTHDDGREGTEHGSAPYGGYDTDKDDFDYEEFIENEFGTRQPKRDWKRPVAWLVIVSLFLPLITALVFLFRSF